MAQVFIVLNLLISWLLSSLLSVIPLGHTRRLKTVWNIIVLVFLLLFNFWACSKTASWKIMYLLFVPSESCVLQSVFICTLYCIGFSQLLCIHSINSLFLSPRTVLMNFISWASSLSMFLKSKFLFQTCVGLAVILCNLNWLLPAVLSQKFCRIVPFILLELPILLKLLLSQNAVLSALLYADYHIILG